MNERETPEAINDRAAEWVARIDHSESDQEMQAELEAWLAGDDRRQGAYFRAQAAWAMLDRASVMGAGRGEEEIGHGGEEEIDHGSRVSRRRVLWGASAAAAASVAALVTGISFWPKPPQRIETAIGEIRRVPLSDGSMAAVNTETRLAVNLKPEIRQVAIASGEAWFQVAHDHKRPFVVEAGDVRVRAVGTAFSVRRTESGADVQVTEGVVEVWSVGDEANIRRVSAGARTLVSNVTGPAAPIEASTAIDRSLAWRSGQLIFDGDTLGEAAVEFNRYNAVKVTISDPALADEKFVGRFRTNEPDAFARAAATILGARATIGSDGITLSRN
ncbi:MAG: FecR domain-containing protein [Sphingomonas sp.]